MFENVQIIECDLHMYFSNPPLEEDDVPNGEFVCHRCVALGSRYEVSSDL